MKQIPTHETSQHSNGSELERWDLSEFKVPLEDIQVVELPPASAEEIDEIRKKAGESTALGNKPVALVVAPDHDRLSSHVAGVRSGRRPKLGLGDPNHPYEDDHS